MNFKVPKDYLFQRLKELKRFTCKEEKEILLLGDDLPTYTEICKILGAEPINELEAIAFIIKMAEISVTDVYNQMFECEKCGIVNESIIDLTELINTEIDTFIPIGLFESPDDIINNTDKLILKDYNKIQDEIDKNNELILNLLIKAQCRSCGTENKFSVSPLKFISKSSLIGLYEEYFSLSFYSNITPSEIDKMYPFEREIFVGLAKKKIETPGGVS